MDEEFIFPEGDSFIIRREINGLLIDYGSFSSLNDAIAFKEELEEDGWPYRKDQIINSGNVKEKSDYGEYISKEDGKFIVSKEFNGKLKVFGKFVNLEDAKQYKYKLIEHAWDDSFKKITGQYGKFIRKEGGKYYVNKSIKGKSARFGPYNSLDEAINARNELIDSNWGVDGDVNLYRENKYGKYISKVKDIFRIGKSFDGEILFFGEYDDLETALEARDILLENDWDESKIPESLYSWRHFVSYSPPTDCFEIYNLIDGHFISFGLFNNHDDVKFALDILRNNGWDAKEIPLDLYSKYSNIRYYDRGSTESFVVVRRVDGELIQYGTFDTYEEAVSKRNELIFSNWAINQSSEEKYDEFIYLRDDGKFYLKNEVNGEMRIFGVFDDFLDAIDARLNCMRVYWNVDSISESEYFNQNNNSSYVDEVSFPVTVGKSYKNGGWAVKRSYLNTLISPTSYEIQSKFIIEGIEVIGKLNIHTRLFYSRKSSLPEYLEELAKFNDKTKCEINLPLEHGIYKFKEKFEFLDFTTRFSRSFKQGMFVMPRSISKDLFDILPYESSCNFYVDGIPSTGRLNIEARILFNNDELISFLEEIKDENEDINVRFLI